MRQPLTKTQYETLEFIRTFLEKKGYCPSFREIGKHFDIGIAATWERMNWLKVKGAIRYNKNSKRGIVILWRRKSF